MNPIIEKSEKRVGGRGEAYKLLQIAMRLLPRSSRLAIVTDGGRQPSSSKSPSSLQVSGLRRLYPSKSMKIHENLRKSMKIKEHL